MFKNYSLIIILSIFLINSANFALAEIIPIKNLQTKEEKNKNY